MHTDEIFGNSHARRALSRMLAEPDDEAPEEPPPASPRPPDRPLSSPPISAPPERAPLPAVPSEPTALPEPVRLTSRPGGHVLLGLSDRDEPTTWDLATASNAFLAVFGASGSGKTEVLRVAAVTSPLPAIVLDYHGDIDVTGGTISVGNVADVNPLEVVSDRGPGEQAGAFVDALRRAVPALGHVQAQELRESLLAAYERAGIHELDDSTWELPAPTIADLQRAIGERNTSPTTRAGLLAAMVQVFGTPSSRRPSVAVAQVMRTGGRLDLSKLSRPAQVVATDVLLGQMLSALRNAGPLQGSRYRLLLVIDEASILRGSAQLDILFREARKFGLAAVIAAQSPADVSASVRNNAGSVLQLALGNSSEAAAAARLLPGVSVPQLQALAPRGDGYFRSGAKAQHVRVLPLNSPQRQELRRLPEAQPSRTSKALPARRR